MTLTPFLATIIFTLGCLAGVQFRRVFKQGGPRWQLWFFGAVAGSALLTVALIPLTVGS